MKDLLFSGADVEEALASAAASLGLPMAELRYVVLEAGTAGGRGLKPTPARIAVFVQENSPAGGPRGDRGERGERRERSERRDPARQESEEGDLRASLAALVRALAEAAGLEIAAEIEEEGEEALILKIVGKDADFFLGEDGRGETLLAFEHLLQRIHGHELFPLTLRVRCEGFRERRDLALGEEARRLAEAVRADGQSRTLPPLNAYERRIVHIALQDAPGVTTYSVGEGRDRRVTVAPKTAKDGDDAPGGGER